MCARAANSGGGRKSASVGYNGSNSSVYRGGNDFTIKPNDISEYYKRRENG